jgi:hypothetical protein
LVTLVEVSSLRYFTFNILRLSSVRGCLHLKQLLSLLWSLKLVFQIWVRSDQWLLIYSTFKVGEWVAGWLGEWLAGWLTNNNATS